MEFWIADLSPFEIRTRSLLDEATTYVIVSPIEAENARLKIKECIALEKEIEEARTSITKPVNDKLKEINNLAKQVTLPATEAKTILTSKINEFMAEQERIRQAALKRLNDEILKIKSLETYEQLDLFITSDEFENNEVIKSTLEIQRKVIEEKITAENERIRREQEQKKLESEKESMSIEQQRLAEERIDLERERRNIEAEKAKLDKEKLESEQAKQLAEVEKQSEAAKVTWTRVQIKREVVDETLVPRELCSPDSKKINAYMKNWIKNIPWINVWEEKIIR